MKKNERPYVLIGMPTFNGQMLYRTDTALQRLMSYCDEREIRTSFSRHLGSLLPNQRQQCVDEAMERQTDYLLCLDSDMVFPQDALCQLMAHDVDAVSGMYFKKTPPFYTVCAQYDPDKETMNMIMDWEEDSMFEVDGTGGGFLLVKTSVLRGISRPHFMPYATKNHEIMGEDYAFCLKLKEAGFKLWLDSSLQLQHIGEYPFGVHDYHRVRMMNERKAREEAAINEGIHRAGAVQ